MENMVICNASSAYIDNNKINKDSEIFRLNKSLSILYWYGIIIIRIIPITAKATNISPIFIFYPPSFHLLNYKHMLILQQLLRTRSSVIISPISIESYIALANGLFFTIGIIFSLAIFFYIFGY